MPGLPTPPSRTLLHNRSIELACFHRADGLFDVEAHLVDTKPFDLVLSNERTKVAGTPIHDMWIRLTFDETMTIVAADAVMDVPAHETCVGAVPNYQSLVGLRIGPGWVREAQKRVKGVLGCTHISEMFTEIGTTAMQGIFGHYNRQRQMGESRGRRVAPDLVDSCFGWRAGGAIAEAQKSGG